MRSHRLPLFLACGAVAALAASLVDDRFADGDSRNQDLAAQSLRVFNSRAGTVRSDAPGQVRFDIANAGGSEAFWAFFTAAGSPLRLDPGDRMSVSVTFAVSGFPANAQDIRFGVFDSLGTRNTADLTGGMNQSTFAGDPGYGLQYFASGSGNAFNIGRRANLTSGNIFNTFGDFLSLAGGGSNPSRQTLAEDTPYTLQMMIERLSETESRITARVTGATIAGDLSYSVLDTGVDLPSSFDYFAFRVTGPAFAQRISFSRILVDYTPAPPVITTQPQPSALTVQAGSRVTFAVGAEGSQLRYQWSRDGVAIDPERNRTAALPILVLEAVPLEAAGTYTVTVSNPGGSVTSRGVVLRVSRDPVAPPPAITRQPVPSTATLGDRAEFSVVASGAGLSYQWLKDGAALPGAVASTLSIAPVQLRDAGSYSVLVSNSSGAIASEAARLTVVSPLTAIETYPANGATGLCVDPPVSITFNAPANPGRTGRILLYRSDGAVADTIDLRSANHTRLIGSTSVPYQYYPVLMEGNTARIFFARGRLTPGESYSIGIEPGAFVDENGAPFRGRLADAWNFTVRTRAPAPGATAITVDAEGNGDFCTVQSAIDHVPANNTRRTVIDVRYGVYPEQVYVAAGKNHITVRSEVGETEIRYPNNANLNSSQRQVFGVDASDFTLENITIRNTTPKGGSQAEAFRGNGQRIVLNFVKLFSFQDTLWLQGQGYVNSSYIEGDVDFMWGNGSVFFKDSELRMVSSGGYYTQIRNGPDRAGNIYLRCYLSAAPGVTGAYLSRIDPNVYPASQVVFIDSVMGPHIRPEGWLLNNATTAPPTLQFFEHNSRDEQGNPLDVSARARFSKQLSVEESARFRDVSSVIPGWDPSPKLAAALVIPDLERNYNGSPQAVTVTTVPPGLPVRVTYAGSAAPPVSVGTYPVSAVVDDETYQGALNVDLVIRPTPVSITLGDLSRVFDGTPKAVRVTTDPPVEGVTVTYDGSANPPVQPGRYAVVARLESPNLRGRTSATLVIQERAPLPAFPGAEGEGAASRGGRGGDVYRVTNLEDSGPGSLRAGILGATGPRTIVFDVSGVIRLRSRLSINKSFLTIAGQTAPGDGVTVAGWPTVISGASHVVVRYMRFRMGDANCPAVQDDALWVDRSSHVILDHVSASWSIDETLSVTDSTQVTVQWSFLTESLRNSCHVKGSHGYGSLLRYGAGQVSFHHNLFAHHDSRNPRLGDNIGLDFVNNVVYDWGSTAGYSGSNDEGSPFVNLVGNAYIPGPSSGRGRSAFSGGGTNTGVYQENNRMNGVDTDWQMITGSYRRREDSRFDLAQVETSTAAQALEQVLALGGASLRRDAVDARIVDEVRSRGGKLIDSQDEVGGWPVLQPGVSPVDSDGDGMPDDWERQQGLNPRDPADGARVSETSGYTNLELYLNSLVAERR